MTSNQVYRRLVSWLNEEDLPIPTKQELIPLISECLSEMDMPHEISIPFNIKGKTNVVFTWEEGLHYNFDWDYYNDRDVCDLFHNDVNPKVDKIKKELDEKLEILNNKCSKLTKKYNIKHSAILENKRVNRKKSYNILIKICELSYD